MDNGTMVKVLLNASAKRCKELINKYQLSTNQSFIRCFIDEYNVLVNTFTPNILQKGELAKKITKLHLIDDLLTVA